MPLAPKSQVKFRGRSVVRRVESVLAGRLTNVLRELRDDVKERLNVPYPPASRPGQSPHRRTNELRGSVFQQKQTPLSGIVGTDVFYGKILERPLEFSRPDLESTRPFLSDEIQRKRDDIEKGLFTPEIT